MWNKIVAFFMAIVAFFCNLFGIDCQIKPGETLNSYVYEDLAYGDHERQKLDLYIPKDNDGEVGLILMIHGGAWVAGDKSGYDDLIREWSDVYGYVTASVNYRYLSYETSFDDILDDIESALYCIKNKAAEKGVTINKMLLSGHSAGGHLSMLYAYARKDSSPIAPAAVVDYCGPTDLLDPSFYGETATDGLKDLFTQIASLAYGEPLTLEQTPLAYDLLKKASPLYYVDKNTVPTVINHGMKDEIVPYTNALSLEAKFNELGVTHIMNPYPHSGHGLGDDLDSQIKADKYFYEYAKTYLN